MRFSKIILAAAALVLAAPAIAGDLKFTATLRGDKEPTNTGSKATGEARIVVHGDTQTVDVSATVNGIAPSDFATHLAHAPVGPMHLHIYATNGDVSLLLPFPMGPEYQAAGGGFTYKRTGYAYAEGAKIVSSTISFDDFVNAMRSGAVVFNIHTNAFGDGEISGKIEVAK
ncbi:MAG: CHRD domain-containing protein [Alphaproteobacteria bacterium]|nr:CHRD domain-containing protein [Alphaproteobacteria bacterium]